MFQSLPNKAIDELVTGVFQKCIVLLSSRFGGAAFMCMVKALFPEISIMFDTIAKGQRRHSLLHEKLRLRLSEASTPGSVRLFSKTVMHFVASRGIGTFRCSVDQKNW